MSSAEPGKYMMINFEETELRLGLPGGGGGTNNINANDSEIIAAKNSISNGKRGFSETVDLKLNLSTKESSCSSSRNIEDAVNICEEDHKMKEKVAVSNSSSNDPAKPPAKAQVVGWPPIRSFRKNVMTVQKNITDDGEMGAATSTAPATTAAAATTSSSNAAFVKVSMDGAPYLRKVDLKLYKSYQELSDALGKMFSSFTIGNCSSQGMKDFMNESKLIDLLNGSEYVPTYEDKDGDWMLVGDVPWEMFVDSCKRLRIMKGSEAIGLVAPRAVEKCKNRS